jgi:hypothetical protein
MPGSHDSSCPNALAHRATAAAAPHHLTHAGSAPASAGACSSVPTAKGRGAAAPVASAPPRGAFVPVAPVCSGGPAVGAPRRRRMQLMNGARVLVWIGPLHPFEGIVRPSPFEEDDDGEYDSDEEDNEPTVDDVNDTIRELEGDAYPWRDW